MIIISIYGLDHFVVASYSKEHTEKLAKLYKISDEEIMFYSPDATFLYKGYDQTSWNTLVKIEADQKFKGVEKEISDYIFKTIELFSINIRIEFVYINEASVYQKFNKEYPRYITEENTVNIEHEHLEDGEELYEGNVFEDIEERIEVEIKRRKKA